MLKKTIRYTNPLTEEEVSEVHLFHISKAELIELEASVPGGFAEKMQSIGQRGDPKEILREFKRIILTAYGVKSEDGNRFIKNQKVRDEFESSEAFSELYSELCTNAQSASEFIQGILPPGLDKFVDELASRNGVVRTASDQVVLSKRDTLTSAEFESLSREDKSEAGLRVARGTLKIVD